jgi:ribonuclease HI
MSTDPPTGERLEHVVVYTDGAAEPNPGPGGYGVVLMAGTHRKEISGGFRRTTNNRMELMGVIVALESLTRRCRVTLHSDSKYVVDSVQRGSVFRWQRNGWYRTKTDKAKNADLWQRFLVAYEKHSVELRWVKGHAGVAENERCDELAVASAQQYPLPPDAGYEEEAGAPTRSISPRSSSVASSPRPASATDSPPEAGKPCRKCGDILVKKIPRPKPPKPGQTFCYAWYLHCPGCGTMYMLEEGKRPLKN